jgi:hypothetical protein
MSVEPLTHLVNGVPDAYVSAPGPMMEEELLNTRQSTASALLPKIGKSDFVGVTPIAESSRVLLGVDISVSWDSRYTIGPVEFREEEPVNFPVFSCGQEARGAFGIYSVKSARFDAGDVLRYSEKTVVVRLDAYRRSVLATLCINWVTNGWFPRS